MTTRVASPQDFWLLDGTGVGNRLKPSAQLIDTAWRAVKLHPARLDALRQWFDEERKEILPGDRLLVFVTDHGGRGGNDRGSGTITLWREQLTVREFRSLLDRLSPQVQVVTVMSQCYSGAFADLMYDRGAQEPSGNTCGFFATTAVDKAYGCYPEGQDPDRIGYAFEFIDALDRQRRRSPRMPRSCDPTARPTGREARATRTCRAWSPTRPGCVASIPTI